MSHFSWAMVWLAVVLAIVIYLLPLAVDFPLLDPDEGLHASIAQEMVERQAWITPTFCGRPFLDKPVLYFWAQVFSLRLLGHHVAAVRLPGLLFALLGAVTTGLLGWRMMGRTAGLTAGILYATSVLPAALAQAAPHDVALIPCVNLAMLFLWESAAMVHGGGLVGRAGVSGAARRAPATRQALIGCLVAAGFFLGLAILAKGLVGPAGVGVAWAIHLLIDRRCTRWHCLSGLFVLLVAAGMAAPWYVAVEIQNPGYLHYYFFERHVLGLVTAGEPHGGQPWWYYLPVLLGGGLPWIGYLPVLLYATRRAAPAGETVPLRADAEQDRSDVPESKAGSATGTWTERDRDSAAVRLLACWLFGWTLVLQLAGSKLATYLWPVFPAVAVLAATAWQRLIDGVLSDAARRLFARTFVWSSWAGPVVLPATVLVVQSRFGVHYAWPAWLMVGLVAAAAPLPVIPWRFGRHRTALAAAAISMALQFLVVMTLVLPPVAENNSARDLAAHFNRLGDLPPRLLVAEERIGSLLFYLSPRIRAELKPGQLQQVLREAPPALLPGDVIVVPGRGVARADLYLGLAGMPYQSIGRHRLYRVP